MLNEINLSRTDLNLLVLFQTVMTEAHVGRAARALNLTPSAVSHGLGRLRRMFNDPLFLRAPKGVVPTERATKLAAPIADVLARVSQIVSAAEPFDPARSRRTFTIGAPDAVILPQLLPVLRRMAPNVDIRMRQLLPSAGSSTRDDAWMKAFAELDARTLDIAIAPFSGVPARFTSHALYDEDFVIASRPHHPFAKSPSLETFCAAQHLLVSQSGDAYGFVDGLLAERGFSRRIALTVPNFMLALAVIADTDLIMAIPRHFVALHAQRFDLAVTEPPIHLGGDPLQAVASKAAMMDEGIAWLFGVLRDKWPTMPAGPRGMRKSSISRANARSARGKQAAVKKR
jgi:DNA-binding transcriptional LysR family regulator